MKKAFFAVLLFGTSCFIPFQSLAACDCTEREIVEKLEKASSYELGGLFEKLADSASFSLGMKTRRAFAEIISSLRDEYAFKEVLGEYIENNCVVQEGKILCRR